MSPTKPWAPQNIEPALVTSGERQHHRGDFLLGGKGVESGKE